ncbi:BREX-3 system phosphatase PglZ [Nostoc sp. DedQUE09]|uniref:BREX-3 system phosphatase PglZ n=1 Tax=Nostoc sp. DedQUE09 TaxID=3075394 RepID=UPI002AD354C6|nr:BREX-3 system phosphatase PglZ [Nostoc sp. DedQUE09]MDZ7954085.1 BREX-3 system phosphatase PglZ [Nostoc sp. DedQUE09]
MNWRNQILKEFTPQVANLTLVADPDGLLTEAEMLQTIQARGFEIVPFEDAIAFRYIYESQYRPQQQQGAALDLIVVVNKDTQEVRLLPYDLVQAGRQLAFSIGSLFPHLSYSVVNSLDRSNFDALYKAQAQHKPEQLGENATKDFILRYVYNIDPDLIQETSDLLLILLRWHYRGQRLPEILCDRFIQTLRDRQLFSTLPLETIIRDRQAFFAFLQQAWTEFVRQHLVKSSQVSEATGTYATVTKLPFDNQDIRIYINHLFLEGYLQPIDADKLKITTTSLESNSWIKVGLSFDPNVDQRRRLQGLLESLDSSIPSSDANYQDWLKFSEAWAKLIVLWHQDKISDFYTHFLTVQEKVDNSFFSWINSRYGTLYSQPPIPPVVLHQIPRFLRRNLEASKTNKVALIVLDGLALDQWLVLKNVLLAQRPQLKFKDETVFAWLPTITSISRQAIFAGKPPILFPNSLETTAKEEQLWKQFWTDQGFNPTEVAYAKGLGETDSLSLLEEKLSPKLRIIGLVVDKVDKIMHGMQLGTAGMHNQVRQWAELGWMANLIDLLLAQKFQIFLTSDHGNIEATGIGQPREGAIADLRGERVRVYSDPILRAKVKSEFPNAIEWPLLGLPEKYLPLLAPGRQAFIQEGKQIVAHGGISVEELVVPFISVSV